VRAWPSAPLPSRSPFRSQPGESLLEFLPPRSLQTVKRQSVPAFPPGSLSMGPDHFRQGRFGHALTQWLVGGKKQVKVAFV
jgi:hypothetical protein